MTTQTEDTDTRATLGAAGSRCPYLVGAGGAWVASSPLADHRCSAVSPPARLTVEKQHRLCLAAEHVSCATYGAAVAAAGPSLAEFRSRAAGWNWARTTPIVDGRVGAAAALAALITERRAWQVIPPVLLVAALGALGLSNLGSAPASPTGSPSAHIVAAGSPTPRATPAPTPSPTTLSSVAPSPSPSPAPTPPPTATPTASPVASARTTYKVNNGDSLYVIARQFSVTVAALKSINGLTSNTIHVGQVLLIP